MLLLPYLKPFLGKMKLVGVMLLAFWFGSQPDQFTVVKKNGDVLTIREPRLFQSNARSTRDIIFSLNGKSESVPISQIKRINLKSVASKSQGVTTWNALLVKRNDQKLEVRVALYRVVGLDQQGNKTKVSSSAIDKISF